MQTRTRLVTSAVALEVDDTQYQLVIPEGASSVRVHLSDPEKAWRFSTKDGEVATPNSGVYMSADESLLLAASCEMQKTILYAATSAGGDASLQLSLSCLVPLVR